jgi:hypothetical protein
LEKTKKLPNLGINGNQNENRGKKWKTENGKLKTGIENAGKTKVKIRPW